MKIRKRAVALVICAVLLLQIPVVFCACGKSDVIMKLDGGYEITSDVFEWIVSYCKTEEYATFMQYLESAGEDTGKYDLANYDFWRTEYGDGVTLADIVREKAVIVAKSYLSASKQFDDIGLKMTDADDDAIEEAIENVKKNLEQKGTDLKSYLKECGTTYKTYRSVLVYQYKINKLLSRLMSPGGLYEVTDKMVTDSYDETVKELGYSNVNHIFLYTLKFAEDGSSSKMSEYDYNNVKNTAEQIYDSLVNGDAQFEEYASISNDKYSPEGYLVSKETDMAEEFVNAAVDMKIGEIRLVESSYGFHVMKKSPITDEQHTEIEDYIRTNLEAEAEERIVDVYYDDIEADEEKIKSYDPVYAPILK